MALISASWRLLLVLLLHLFAFVVGSALSPPPLPDGAEANPAGAMAGLVAVAAIHTAVMAVLVRASALRGARLLGSIGLLFWGANAALAQIEVAFFAPASIPEGTAVAVLGMSTIHALLWLPPSVWLLARWAGEPAPLPERVAPSHIALRLAAIAMVYVGLYLSFGYFVALRQPAVQAYYGIADPGSFAAQLRHIATASPELIPFQLARGLAWAGIGWPVLASMRGPWWLRGVWLGLGYAAFMNAAHLLPNPLMPDAVRWAHLLETAPSNFLLGLVVAWGIAPREGRDAGASGGGS